jgi:hypothetical protein
MLPVDVLEEAQKDLLNWKGSGMSVMEMSHRGKDFMGIASKAEADLRELMSIPDNYKVPPTHQFPSRSPAHNIRLELQAHGYPHVLARSLQCA